jgi:hypothetical protein
MLKCISRRNGKSSAMPGPRSRRNGMRLCVHKALFRRQFLPATATQRKLTVAGGLRCAKNFYLGFAIWFFTNPDVALFEIHFWTSFSFRRMCT